MPTSRQKRLRTFLLSQDSTNRSIALTPGQEPPAVSVPEPSDPLAEQEAHFRQRLQETIRKGEQFTAQGAHAKALSAYAEILNLLREDAILALPERVQLRGLVHMNTAWIYHQQSGDLEAALEQYTEAIDCLEPIRGLAHDGILSSLMISYRQRSQVQRRLGNMEAALADLEASARRQQELVAPENAPLEILEDWLGLAAYQIELERWHPALDSLVQAEKLLPHLSLEQALRHRQTLLAQRAQILERLDEPLAALHSYDQLLETFDQKNQALLWARYALLRSVAAFGLPEHEHDAELQAIAQTLQQVEEQDLERHELVVPLLGLAELCQQAQRENWALNFYAAAIRCLERSQTERDEQDQLYLMQAYAGRAQLLQERGELTKALSAFRQARRLARNLVHNLSGSEALASLNLQMALAYQAAQKSAEALKLLTETIAFLSPLAGPLTAEHPLVRAHYLRAFLLCLEQDDAESAQIDFEAVEALCPGLAAYDIACLQVRNGEPESAFVSLRQHLASPYALSQDEIEADVDLQALHGDARWQALWD